MSVVCYCGRPDCSVTSLACDACLTALRAERDALQKAADANMALAETLDRTLAATLDERDALRAQVEAARAVAQEMDAGWRIEAAMDEAVKPASCDCRRGCVKCSPWLW